MVNEWVGVHWLIGDPLVFERPVRRLRIEV